MFRESCTNPRPGQITLFNIDRDNRKTLSDWLMAQAGISTGAMGTRAKQQAENDSMRLDFTYGVIDKCILKALRGEDSLILTTESMVERIHQRVDSYRKESGTRISVCLFGSPDAENDGKQP